MVAPHGGITSWYHLNMSLIATSHGATSSQQRRGRDGWRPSVNEAVESLLPTDQPSQPSVGDDQLRCQSLTARTIAPTPPPQPGGRRCSPGEFAPQRWSSCCGIRSRASSTRTPHPRSTGAASGQRPAGASGAGSTSSRSAPNRWPLGGWESPSSGRAAAAAVAAAAAAAAAGRQRLWPVGQRLGRFCHHVRLPAFVNAGCHCAQLQKSERSRCKMGGQQRARGAHTADREANR